MDKSACWHASEETLESLGLSSKGDVIHLKGFCMQNQSVSESIKYSSKERISTTLKKKYKNDVNRLQGRTVYLSWMNYDSYKDRYINVRNAKGGGSRVESFQNGPIFQNVLDKMKALFFPSGKSIFGLLEHFETGIGNLKDGLIPTSTNLSDYITNQKLTKTRLYFMTKLLPKQQRVINHFKSSLLKSDPESSDDDFLSPPSKKFDLVGKSVSVKKADRIVDLMQPDQNFERSKFMFNEHSDDENHPTIHVSEVFSLLGSSLERESLRNEIDTAFQESLASDQEKILISKRIDDEEQRLQDLMEVRKSRLSDEPSLEEPHEMISVRHPILGTKVRLFKENSTFVNVYDWVGSLNKMPEYFEILDYQMKVTSPETIVYSGIFNIKAVDGPILMSPEGTVSFRGFGVKASTEDDSNDYVNQCDVTDYYKQLEKIRMDEKERFTREYLASVSRESVYNDMVQLYKKRHSKISILKVTFIGENAVGDGVTRDVYAEFYESFYAKLDGHLAKIPQAHFNDEELEYVGMIITHGFLLYNIFPVGLSKISLKHYLYQHNISNDEYFNAFLSYVTPWERNLINKFKSYEKVEKQAIMDILSEYSVFKVPTPENIHDLILEAAKLALIRQPCYPFHALVNGMGDFWKKTTPEMLDSLYSSTIPTADDIIQNIQSNECSVKEQNITTWLHLYLRSCGGVELGRVIRFITGSESYPPGTIIKIEYVNQPVEHLHPLSKTCFKILILPRQFSSFFHLKKTLDFYISGNNWEVCDF